ncbi:MAG: pyruvate:ferredoxin (flavodoxin) oxidoreductase [Bradymonadales bacterium]|nr:pyruvate:ferredoxin (flavodoxin) oxidoreductase [Bradymonadales bacterium]
MNKMHATIEGNEAVAYVAHRTNEVIAIYPITPSSGMGEWADEWSAKGQRNIWNTIPLVVEMQSEGGAAAACHGALQTGALTTTFTASQGLLLMIPNMYKIAGELTGTVFHVAARTLATHALSIFGDHSDVMAVRATGWGLVSSGSVQEAHDFALISQVAALRSRIPFVHFFEGFRITHEVAKIELIDEEVMRAMIPYELVEQQRARAMTPDRPVLRGTAQNPDHFFQMRETINPFYDRCCDLFQDAMDQFAGLTGRQYQLFQYHGPQDAERIVVMMGSGAQAAHETVDYLNAHGEKVGLLKVRVYRPFDGKRFIESLPASTRAIAVLDRTKEPGAGGEPLYLDVVHALYEGLASGHGSLDSFPVVVGGRYGLSSKDFTAAMAKGVYDNLALDRPKNHFTIGINDDLTHTSLAYDKEFSVESEQVVRALFYGLGADGTVGANKNSIKIIGKDTDSYAQGYFVYDSRKAGAVTVSHLRFGPDPIRSSYLINKANFIACHQWSFLERYDLLRDIVSGGTFLINSVYGPDEVWDHLPAKVQQAIIRKKLKLFVIDAYEVAKQMGMGSRINTVMQTCFFAISGVLPKEEAIAAIKREIEKTYGKKGEQIVQMNFRAVDESLSHLHEVTIPEAGVSGPPFPPIVPDHAPEFVKKVIAPIISGDGEDLSTSMLPCDGTFPTGTAQWEKRNIALEIPVWDPQVCIQCGKCSMVCPHATIRMKVVEPGLLEDAPETFKFMECKTKDWKGMKFCLQVAPEDCTGCGLCVEMCPAKNKAHAGLKAINMAEQMPIREQERRNWEFFLKLPDLDRRQIKVTSVRTQQVQRPLFEFSGSCAGCGETPYYKLLSQLFGDRAVIANATGCSSIYCGNLPTTPFTKDHNGRGPTWSNSLFEDNAEFGMGFRLSIDKQKEFAMELVARLAPQLGDELVGGLLTATQKTEADIYEQRMRVAALKEKLDGIETPEARQLLDLADMLVKKSVWVVGGDGWAYDIGFGGLDHVLASGRNVNMLVLDTEVYSNTGGQMSKATPLGAVAKFAAGGKPAPKKDLGLIAMTYNTVYVARVAMGAKDEQTLKAFIEAEAYDGPSLIIAYCHCIAHGITMRTGMKNQEAAVDSGQWILYRFNPDLVKEGKNPLQIDSRAAKIPVEEYLKMENRFRMLTKSRPEEARRLFAKAQLLAERNWRIYNHLASFDPEGTKTTEG